MNHLLNLVHVPLILADVGPGRHQESQEGYLALQFGMAVQHQLVGFEPPDDIFVRLGAVDAHDGFFVAQGQQLCLGFQGAGRVGDALDFAHVDGYGVHLHFRSVALPSHRKVMVVNLSAG